MSKVIDRIRKLLAQAESAGEIGSQAEAETFAAAAQDLALEHGISLLDVTEEERKRTFVREKVDRPYKRRRAPLWQDELHHTISYAFNVVALVVPGTNVLFFAGTETDTTLAKVVYLRLCDFAIAERDRVRRAHPKPLPKRFSETFFTGFNLALWCRVRERRKAFEAVQGDGALVRVDNIRTEVNDWLREELDIEEGGKRKEPPKPEYNAAFRAGYRTGQNAPIETNRLEGGA